MLAQIDSTIVNISNSYPVKNELTFPQANLTLDYQLTIQVSEYFLNSLFWAVNDAVNVTIPPNPKITTTTVQKIVGNLKVFDNDQNCSTNLWTGRGQTPLSVTLGETHTVLDMQFTTDFYCMQKMDDPTYYFAAQASWNLDLQFYYNITNNMTLYLNVENTAIKCRKGCSLTFNTIVLPLAQGVITRKINDKFPEPKPIGAVLEAKHLGALNLSEMCTWAEDQYLLFAVTPQFRGYHKRHPSITEIVTAFEPELSDLFGEIEEQMNLMLLLEESDNQ